MSPPVGLMLYLLVSEYSAATSYSVIEQSFRLILPHPNFFTKQLSPHIRPTWIASLAVCSICDCLSLPLDGVQRRPAALALPLRRGDHIDKRARPGRHSKVCLACQPHSPSRAAAARRQTRTPCRACSKEACCFPSGLAGPGPTWWCANLGRTHSPSRAAVARR